MRGAFASYTVSRYMRILTSGCDSDVQYKIKLVSGHHMASTLVFMDTLETSGPRGDQYFHERIFK